MKTHLLRECRLKDRLLTDLLLTDLQVPGPFNTTHMPLAGTFKIQGLCQHNPPACGKDQDHRFIKNTDNRWPQWIVWQCLLMTVDLHRLAHTPVNRLSHPKCLHRCSDRRGLPTCHITYTQRTVVTNRLLHLVVLPDPCRPPTCAGPARTTFHLKERALNTRHQQPSLICKLKAVVLPQVARKAWQRQ